MMGKPKLLDCTDAGPMDGSRMIIKEDLIEKDTHFTPSYALIQAASPWPSQYTSLSPISLSEKLRDRTQQSLLVLEDLMFCNFLPSRNVKGK